MGDSQNVYPVNYNIYVGETKWLFFTADHHKDNPLCQDELLYNHMSEAKKRDASIFMLGDTFCLMQGKGDPRRDKDSIRPEHNTATYIDTVIDDLTNFYSEFSDNIKLIGKGNHETKIKKHLETDVTHRLVKQLSNHTNTEIKSAGYGGFIPMKFTILSPSTGKRSKDKTLTTYFFHGSGGSAPVSKGTMQANRKSAHIDADLMVQGHIHELWHIPYTRVRLDRNYSGVIQSTLDHIQLASYKNEFKMEGGFQYESGTLPKQLGSYWVAVTPECIGNDTVLQVDVIAANRWYKSSSKKSQPIHI